MKCRLKEMEEATTIRDTQSNVTKEMQGPIAGRQHIQLVVRNNDELTKFLGAITMLPTVC
ncbi:hypothetical protein BDA96_02G268400 [Sorghum bicolor]|nr:hypothetical protein BDA96_02G268400 [Sorghum bicolor]